MPNVLIDEIHLISIAEGLRRAKGATKIIYVPTEVPVDPKKYSHTPNASGFDTYSGGYGTNKQLFDTVTIPGAVQLQVDLQYHTEGTSYDYLYIVPGTVTSMPSSGTKYGGTKNRTTLTFAGDTITFCFRSDGSQDNYLGYYAEIVGLDADGNIVGEGETITVDVPTEVPNIFRPCDMALENNARIYYVGTTESILDLLVLNSESNATGSLN